MPEEMPKEMPGEKPEESISVNKLSKLQLTEVDTCSKCAHCAEYCPTYTGTKKPELIPGGKATSLSRLVDKQKGLWSRLRKPKPVSKEELEKIASNLYTCTLCGRCHVVCPFSIQTEDLWRKTRAIMYDAGLSPQPIMMLDGGIEQKGNPYNSNADLRTMWTDFMDSSEVPVKEKAELVFFVGCTSALKAQTQDIPAAVAAILNRVGEDWTFIGEEERCCGSPSLMIGHWEKARELAKHNTALFEARGARRIVTNCPGCYRALKKYPELVGHKLDFEVFHFVELMNEYLKNGRISIKEKFKEKIVYHDPCELGRLSGITEDPRAVLSAITEQPVEFPENRSDSRCCGGGGLLMAVNGDLRLQIGEYRVNQAKKVGAEIITSACPSCKMVLDDAAKSLNTGMKVLDLAELVALWLAASPHAKP
ncbi:MAG: hypothetical protein A2Z75_06195 [Chloroflexi bacterium RBG_13_50_10]|nr:MAG: hypothetical protein A2Z75_06195 [Chloroflexi bacterium RBG_13_50_10]